MSFQTIFHRVTMIWPNVFGYRTVIAKISLKSLHSFWNYMEKPWGGGGRQNDPPFSPLRVKSRSQNSTLFLVNRLRTTVLLGSYIRNSLRFLYNASPSTCYQNLKKKNGVTRKIWEKVGVKVLRGLTEKSVNFSTLATSQHQASAIFWWSGSINKVSPISQKKDSWSPKKNARKWQYFNETISHNEPKFYRKTHSDCNIS